MMIRRFQVMLCTIVLAGLAQGCGSDDSSGDGGESGERCTPATKRCVTGNVEVCNADGTAWVFYRDCAGATCTAGTCQSAEGEGEGEGPAEGEGEGEGAPPTPASTSPDEDEGCACSTRPGAPGLLHVLSRR